MQPKISILIPYYNDKKFLAQAIDSVLVQSFQDFELVLLDHASTDGSHDIARSYRDSRIRHVRMEKNIGAGGGLLFIEFLKVANGLYIKPFCADDVMNPDCLKILSAYLDRNTRQDAVFADMEFVDENLKLLNESWFSTRRKITEVEIAYQYLHCRGSILPYPTAMMRRSAIDENSFDKVCIQIADHFLWTSMILRGSKFGYIDDKLVQYRIHLEQVSSSSNRNVDRRSVFENIVFPGVFLKLKNVGFLKLLLRESLYAQSLVEGENDLIPFVLAEHCSHAPHPSTKVWGLSKLHEILSNDEQRRRIENRFGYGVRELRVAYSRSELLPSLEDLGFLSFVKMALRKFKRAGFRAFSMKDRSKSVV